MNPLALVHATFAALILLSLSMSILASLGGLQ